MSVTIAPIAPLILILMMLNLLVIALLELMITAALRRGIGLAGIKTVNSCQRSYGNLYTKKPLLLRNGLLFYKQLLISSTVSINSGFVFISFCHARSLSIKSISFLMVAPGFASSFP